MNSFFSKINGTTFRPEAQEIIRNLNKGVGLLLIREPLNPYDKNAIKVMLDDEHLGYIPKGTAESLAKDMDEGREYYAVVSEVTGLDKKNVGCNIEVFRRE
jgi:hypothetical protein